MRGRPVVIIGAGAVGSILGANFAHSGQDVIVVEVDRPRREQVLEVGLKVVGKDKLDTRPVKVLDSIEALSGIDAGAIFVCTKSWSLKAVLPQLAASVGSDALVVSFQNGIGVEDDVARFFTPDRVARGIVNYAGSVDPASGVVTESWFNPPNYLGPVEDGAGGRLEQLAGLLSRSRLSTVAIPAYETKKRVFFKTILNSALNALCAISGITMRQAMSYRHTRNLANMLIREGLSVASAVGYNYGEHAREVCIKYLDEGGDHLPSMWTDLQLARPTEIEYINGKIVKIGLMFKNVDVDANVFFTSLVITQEIKSGVRKPDDVPEYLKHF
jgi:2-dehydropantoate 2-reductase